MFAASKPERDVVYAWKGEVDDLRKDNARLREALKHYGDHTYECDLMKNERDCICGYDAALSI